MPFEPISQQLFCNYMEHIILYIYIYIYIYINIRTPFPQKYMTVIKINSKFEMLFLCYLYNLYILVYTCIYFIYLYILVYTCIYLYILVYTCIYLYILVYTCIYLYILVYTCILKYKYLVDCFLIIFLLCCRRQPNWVTSSCRVHSWRELRFRNRKCVRRQCSGCVRKDSGSDIKLPFRSFRSVTYDVFITYTYMDTHICITIVCGGEGCGCWIINIDI